MRLASLLFGLWQKTTLLLLRGLRRAEVLFRKRLFSFLFVLRNLLYQSLLRALIHDEIIQEKKSNPARAEADTRGF